MLNPPSYPNMSHLDPGVKHVAIIAYPWMGHDFLKYFLRTYKAFIGIKTHLKTNTWKPTYNHEIKIFLILRILPKIRQNFICNMDKNPLLGNIIYNHSSSTNSFRDIQSSQYTIINIKTCNTLKSPRHRKSVQVYKTEIKQDK